MRTFRSRRDYVKGERRKLHSEELGDMYSSPSIVRVIKSRRKYWAGHVALTSERCVKILLVDKPEGNRSIGRPRLR